MWIEYCGLIALSIYYVHACASSANRALFALRCLQVLIGSWCCEAISIDLFGFYQYSDVWRLMIGKVPFLVIAAWPAIIMSAGDLARYLGSSGPNVVWWTALIVLLDAGFIEPICVRAQLWGWNAPGLLNVPLIGILGWAVFAGACAWQFNAHTRSLNARRFLGELALIIVATVLILWLLWQILFRFVTVALDERVVLCGTTLGLVVLAIEVLRVKKVEKVPSSFFVVRTPGFILIAMLFSQFEKELTSLHIYAFAFVAFYTVLIAWELFQRKPYGVLRRQP